MKIRKNIFLIGVLLCLFDFETKASRLILALKESVPLIGKMSGSSARPINRSLSLSAQALQLSSEQEKNRNIVKYMYQRSNFSTYISSVVSPGVTIKGRKMNTIGKEELDAFDTVGDIRHVTADPSHYDKSAEHYDIFNEKKSAILNNTVASVLARHRPDIERIVDLTCGTGSQVFALTKLGYRVTGADINSRMLQVAKKKATDRELNLDFIEGDIRSVQLGSFDAAISMFNAVGHLTKEDFEAAMKNVHSNLRYGGLYIFDIFNSHYFLKDDNISELTIDWPRILDDGSRVRDIQYSTITKEGILASYTVSYVEKPSEPVQVFRNVQTLQIYSATELTKMLSRCGFSVLNQSGVDGTSFKEGKTDRIITVAKRQ